MQKNGTGSRPFHFKKKIEYEENTRWMLHVKQRVRACQLSIFSVYFNGLFYMITGCYFNDVHRFILRAEKTSSADIAGFVC